MKAFDMMQKLKKALLKKVRKQLELQEAEKSQTNDAVSTVSRLIIKKSSYYSSSSSSSVQSKQEEKTPSSEELSENARWENIKKKQKRQALKL